MKKTVSTTLRTTKSWHKPIEARATTISTGEPVRLKTVVHLVKSTRVVDVKEYQSRGPARPALLQRMKWRDTEYRQAYMEASIEQGIAWQIRLNRELRDWSQRELAAAVGTGQSAISRLEDPTYGAHSLDTLIKVAHAFDCALSVKFISYSQLAFESERLGEAEQCAVPFSVELENLNAYKEAASEKSSLDDRHIHSLR